MSTGAGSGNAGPVPRISFMVDRISFICPLNCASGVMPKMGEPSVPKSSVCAGCVTMGSGASSVVLGAGGTTRLNMSCCGFVSNKFSGAPVLSASLVALATIEFSKNISFCLNSCNCWSNCGSSEEPLSTSCTRRAAAIRTDDGMLRSAAISWSMLKLFRKFFA